MIVVLVQPVTAVGFCVILRFGHIFILSNLLEPNLKPASISEIKQELNNATQKQLLELCLRLIKYKKENKELLSYLLFEDHDVRTYVESVKKEIDEQFSGIN